MAFAGDLRAQHLAQTQQRGIYVSDDSNIATLFVFNDRLARSVYRCHSSLDET